MLTSRGWWFLIGVLCLLALGILDERWPLTLLALTLLLWFLAEWLIFVLRVRLAVPALQVARTVADDRGAATNLWAGRTFHVNVRVTMPHWLGLPFLKIAEYIPFGVVPMGGQTENAGALAMGEGLNLQYSMCCGLAGRVRFEGVRVETADLQGFFYHTGFLPGLLALRVLPPLADARGHRPTVKRHNLLPSPGLHRHMRPGSGSELLDLRDYLPGDPPKTIAWKISARRDRLITKEFESEVPLRCTLFVDTSQSVRLGPPGRNALARLVDISAAMAQATAAARDLSGLCLFDDAGVLATIRPARGSRHLVQLLNILADAAGMAPASGAARVPTLLPLACALAEEVQPQLLGPEVNYVPPWLPWFWPIPERPRERAAFLRRAVGLLATASSFVPLAGIAWLAYLFSDPLAYIIVPVPETMLLLLAVGLLASTGMFYYALLKFLRRAFFLVFARRRRQLARWRKQMAALLAERYGLGAGGIGMLLEDDERCVIYLQQFLAEHNMPFPVPLYDRAGRYLFASPKKVDVLARALLHAVGKGRDNEMFVLLVDLLELPDNLEPLRRAVKITLARHHQVVIVCPWPPGVAPPRAHGLQEPTPAAPIDFQAVLQTAATERLHRAFYQLRRTFARLGVLVVCSEGTDPVRLLLDRLDRLRSVGLGRKR
jgi:uncharacterized protein (DUF58 family)